MRVLMVSHYPPVRDGIGNYALQAVAALLDEGHEVEVVSPWPSAAHHHLDFRDPEQLGRLVELAADRDRVIVQFHPEMFRSATSTPDDRAAVYDALVRVLDAAGRSELRVHEFDYGEAEADSRRLRNAARTFWQAADLIELHTEHERDDLVKLFRVDPARVAVVQHGAHFERRTTRTKAEARHALGLPEREAVFVAIGFIQPHKGFDRAVRAFAGLDRAGARLDVVGSVRVEEPQWIEYRDELAALVAQTPGAHFHDDYVGDEEFDQWLVAADVVLLPYRQIWSSSVLERALLYGARVIVTRVGGLAEQAGSRDNVVLVSDDSELAAAMRNEARGERPAAEKPVDWSAGDRSGVMAEVRRRAALERALEPDPTAPSVRVSGYLRDGLGLGQVARMYLEALQAAGLRVSTLSFDPDPPDSGVERAGRAAFAEIQGPNDPDFNIICMNGDQLPRFAREAGPGFFARPRNIGVWGWETDVLPGGWQEAAALLDEVWTYSRFGAENLGALIPLPVIAMPPPVTAPPTDADDPLGLAGRFSFLFTLDLMSTLRRKNPRGLIEAYQQAFAPGDGAELVIKTTNAELRPQPFEELEQAASGREDIRIVDRYVTEAEKGSMLAACGAYVSLHRSEGFGLSLAEAMVLGKPVIATRWSGNLEFMTDANAFLVESSPSQVGAGDEIYPAEGRWAEPNLEHAASVMRHVFEDRADGARRGERARADIAEQLSPQRCGARVRERLDLLTRQSVPPEPVAAAQTSDGVLRELDRRLGFDVRRGMGSGRGRLLSLPRRILLRLMLPFTLHEREFDRELVRALRSLDERLRAIESGRGGHR